MKKLKYILFAVCASIALVLTGLYFFTTPDWIKNANVDVTVFKPYVVNTEIDFIQNGNSDDYIFYQNGWGGQEPKWRCTVGKNSEIKLYVKDGQNTPLVLKVTGFGAYDKEQYSNQPITVFANDTEVAKWEVSGNTTYIAKIPADVMVDNKLVIRMEIGHPYVSNIDSRALGMAVRKIVINKLATNQMKIKIGKWVKNKLKNIEVPEYEDSNNVKKEKSDH